MVFSSQFIIYSRFSVRKY